MCSRKVHELGAPLVVADVKPLGTHVIICDWHGTIRWFSGGLPNPKTGDLLWKNASQESLKDIKQAFGQVVTLQEKAVVEVSNNKGQHFRLWLWPLDSAEMAVCILGMAIPKQLVLLSRREREILDLLAQGRPSKKIAEMCDVSLSSVHTHLRRAREKLSLESSEALLAFAAQHCQPGWEAAEAPIINIETTSKGNLARDCRVRSARQ